MIKHYNNWKSTLLEPITFSDTVLRIPAAGTGPLDFGDYDHTCFMTLIGVDEDGAEVQWEIVEAQALTYDGDDALITVVRGFDNTNSRNWPAGTRIENRLIAYVLNYGVYGDGAAP